MSSSVMICKRSVTRIYVTMSKGRVALGGAWYSNGSDRRSTMKQRSRPVLCCKRIVMLNEVVEW